MRGSFASAEELGGGKRTRDRRCGVRHCHRCGVSRRKLGAQNDCGKVILVCPIRRRVRTISCWRVFPVRRSPGGWEVFKLSGFVVRVGGSATVDSSVG